MICPVGDASTSTTLSSRIRADLEVQSALAGCADKLFPLASLPFGQKYEVYGLWVPGLFRSPRIDHRMVLELQHLKRGMPLDRPIVIAIMADIEDVGNVTVEVDSRMLDLTAHNLTILVSDGRLCLVPCEGPSLGLEQCMRNCTHQVMPLSIPCESQQ